MEPGTPETYGTAHAEGSLSQNAKSLLHTIKKELELPQSCSDNEVLQETLNFVQSMQLLQQMDTIPVDAEAGPHGSTAFDQWAPGADSSTDAAM